MTASTWRPRFSCKPQFTLGKLTMRVLVPALVVVFLVAFMAVKAVSQAQRPLATAEHRVLMERKLKTAQAILAGVAREDFAAVEKHAQMLILLSNEAGWNVLQTPEYMRLSEDFRATSRQLTTAAKAKNLDATGLAFLSLSISCIDCHRHVRDNGPRFGSRRPQFGPGPGLITR